MEGREERRNNQARQKEGNKHKKMMDGWMDGWAECRNDVLIRSIARRENRRLHKKRKTEGTRGG